MNFYEKYMNIIGPIGNIMFYLQAYKIFTTQHAKDVSAIGFIAGLVSVTSWLVYGVILRDKPLVIANVIAFLGALVTLVGIIIYR